jgi:hypothetical protein
MGNTVILGSNKMFKGLFQASLSASDNKDISSDVAGQQSSLTWIPA